MMPMQYISNYHSPLGDILIAADTIGVTGLWFEEQKYYARNLPVGYREKQLPLLEEVKHWLDIYFSGKEPKTTIPLHFLGTEFQLDVWRILLTIPYGHTMIYGEIARQLAAQRGMKRMSAQAVGSAVGHNPISIIVPCHRVIGAKGNLTGYAGGLERKQALLRLEKII